MHKPDVPHTDQERNTADGRDRLEILRFASADAQRQAIRVLIDCGMLNFSSNREEEWLIRTPIARKLRELGSLLSG
jgi:hypothetical protein